GAPASAVWGSRRAALLFATEDFFDGFDDRYDDDAPFRDRKAAAEVALEIDANLHAIGDHHVLVDDRIADDGPFADADAPKEDRIGDFGAFFDAHLRAENTTAHAAPGDDRPRGDDTVE